MPHVRFGELPAITRGLHRLMSRGRKAPCTRVAAFPQECDCTIHRSSDCSVFYFGPTAPAPGSRKATRRGRGPRTMSAAVATGLPLPLRAASSLLLNPALSSHTMLRLGENPHAQKADRTAAGNVHLYASSRAKHANRPIAKFEHHHQEAKEEQEREQRLRATPVHVPSLL
jgi:hypothetical protein